MLINPKKLKRSKNHHS